MLQAKILPLWRMVDQIYYQCNRLQLVEMDKGNIFRVRPTTYQGYPLQTSDGKIISSGDKMLKIHLYNYLLMKQMIGLDSEIRRAFYVYECVERSLPGLADYLRSHPEAEQMKGIIGVTLLNRGVKKLGFDTFEIKNFWYKAWKQSYLKPLYYLFHGAKINNKSNKLAPTYLVMSKEKLFHLYLRRSPDFPVMGKK